jgi:hypothetical protein
MSSGPAGRCRLVDAADQPGQRRVGSDRERHPLRTADGSELGLQGGTVRQGNQPGHRRRGGGYSAACVERRAAGRAAARVAALRVEDPAGINPQHVRDR